MSTMWRAWLMTIYYYYYYDDNDHDGHLAEPLEQVEGVCVAADEKVAQLQFGVGALAVGTAGDIAADVDLKTKNFLQ